MSGSLVCQFLPYRKRLRDVKELKLLTLEKILVSSLRKNKLGYVTLCCFLFFYCMLKPSEICSSVTCNMGIFIVGVNHTLEYKSLMLLIICKY